MESTKNPVSGQIKYRYCLLTMVIGLWAVSWVKAQNAEATLAEQYCGSCHQYTPPDMFEAAHWKTQILPRMAQFMGIYKDSATAVALQRHSTAYPLAPMLSQSAFDSITNFFVKNAALQPAPPVFEGDTILPFEPIIPLNKVIPPGSSMVRIGPGDQITIGDVYAKKLLFFNSNDLSYRKGGFIDEGIVDLETSGDTMWITVMGSFSPSEAAQGYLLQLITSTGNAAVIQDSLQRPVQTTRCDLDKDGDMDFLICEFGKYTGKVTWLEQTLNGQWRRHTLFQKSGAISAQVEDTNQDGDLDIMVLFGQADEGILRLLNDGQQQFEPELLLRFSPAHGSSSMLRVDINNDGHQDIVYTCGDNADFAPLYKPWHGIYIYLNDGSEQYQMAHFIHLPGAYQAAVHDFDFDGDLDIAAIAFFPEYNVASPDFLYAENTGQLQYTLHYTTTGQWGRWITMDTGDTDHDGDIDIVLGSMAFEVPNQPKWVNQWKKQGIPFILLKNKRF